VIQLFYSQEAIADLQRLREFIAENNPTSAQRIARELISRVEQLQVMPNMGKPVDSAPDREVIRDMVFGNYTVRYAIHGEVLVILRLWHHYENRK